MALRTCKTIDHLTIGAVCPKVLNAMLTLTTTTMNLTATPVPFDKDTHQYDSPRQRLYALNVCILHNEQMGKHLLVSQSHPRFDMPETMVFLADEVGNILSYTELDMSDGHVEHDEMIRRSPHQLTD